MELVSKKGCISIVRFQIKTDNELLRSKKEIQNGHDSDLSLVLGGEDRIARNEFSCFYI